MDPKREVLVHDSDMTTNGAAGQPAVQDEVQTCQTTDMLPRTLHQERSETKTPMQEGNRFCGGRGNAPL